jgi:hypothetical protein
MSADSALQTLLCCSFTACKLRCSKGLRLDSTNVAAFLKQVLKRTVAQMAIFSNRIDEE